MPPIYLDYNATTPIDPQVAAAMQAYLSDHFGNPGSAHDCARVPREAIALARNNVAGLLHSEPDEIIFTSGGSEANNLALKGVFEAKGGGHIITSAVEHPAVMEVCRYLEKRGAEITIVPVDTGGRVSAQAVADAITKDTILISIMHANNEVGTIQPIREIGAIAKKAGVLFHCDAAQSIGKVPVSVKDLQVDLLTVAGHKFYAHKGAGALYCRRGVQLAPQIHGGGQENGLRAGTENTLQIVGLGKAAELASQSLQSKSGEAERLRDRLEKELLYFMEDCRVNGDRQHRLPNTLSLGIAGIEANALVDILADEVAFSAGAACHSGQVNVSATLRAMGVPDKYAAGTIRLSTGRFTTDEDISKAIPAILKAVSDLRILV